MRKSCIMLACAVLVSLCAAAARADIRVKKTTTFSGRGEQQQVEGGDETGRRSAPPEFTTEEMIKGQRKRTEQLIQFAPNAPGIKRISVEQCDLKRTLDISEAAKKYYVTPIGGVDETNTGGEAAAGSGSGAGRTTRGGIVTYTRTVTDTGERRQMFGFTARHLKTSMTKQASPDACDKGETRYEQDGWYIDLEVNFECLVNEPPPQRAMGRAGGCQDRFVYRNTGAARLGYALEETTRTYARDQKGEWQVQSETTTKVTELSRATLDPALFDVPAGYQQASSQSELYDQRAMMQAMMQAQGAGNEGEGSPPAGGGASAGGTNSTPNAPNAGTVGAKQPGAIRVGVVRVGNKTTQSVDAGNYRSTLLSSIIASGIEAVAIDETAPDAAQAEAKQKECDYVLFTDISSLKQSAANKIGGMFGRATGMGSSAERYEAKLDYTLVPVAGGAPTQASVSAKEDGGADVSANSALRKEAQAVVAKVHK